MINWINVSGGKDSTAMLLWTLEEGLPNCRYVYADTGWEHPAVYEYLTYLEQKTGVTIERVSGPVDFMQMVINHRMFPTKPRRFCTQELKHWPLCVHMADHEESTSKNPHHVWIGVRRQESAARAALSEFAQKEVKYQKRGHQKRDPMGVSHQLLCHPILDWRANSDSSGEVFDIHRRHGVELNPLYKMGMGRVGCFPCIMANQWELKRLFKQFPERVEMIKEMERRVNEVSKEGRATFFPEDKSPKGVPSDIESFAAYLHDGDEFPEMADEPGGCLSIYGLCE